MVGTGDLVNNEWFGRQDAREVEWEGWALIMTVTWLPWKGIMQQASEHGLYPVGTGE